MDTNEGDNFSVVKIKILPPDISDEEIVNFLRTEVDQNINKNHIKSEKTNHSSTNVYLGPGSCLLIVAKAGEFLDYKTSTKEFF